MEHAQQINTTEDKDAKRKRLCTATRPPKVIVKFTGINLGLRRTARTVQKEEVLNAKAGVENRTHDLDVNHHRGTKDDSGFCAVKRATGVRLDCLIEQLINEGYVYVGGHSFQKPGDSDTTNVLRFVRGGVAEPMPAVVNTTLFGKTFTSVYAWCNLKVDDEGTPIEDGKPDTINAVVLPHTDSVDVAKAAKLLMTADNSYEVR